MAEGVKFFDGAEASGKGPGSTIPAQPKTGSGPIEFFDGAESMSGMSVPTNPANGDRDVPKGGANLIDSPLSE